MERPIGLGKFFGLVLSVAAAAAPVRAYDVNLVHGPVRIEVAPGLKFDPQRFVVLPGSEVTVIFHNPDEMIHNFVITKPGARLAVVNAALALGADGPGRNFVPASDAILWATKALSPGETTTLKFVAPREEGVYPYVCTFPGHGFVMYGAMYVTTGRIPNPDADPNVPPPTIPQNDEADHSHGIADRPLVCRTYLPDCGPSAIAIGLPGGQSYCFDADSCRLRYAWRGGFVDNTDQWMGKGDLWSKVVGVVYYRAPDAAAVRIGDPGKQPKAQWLGYEMIQGYPQLQYTLDGVEVHEIAHPLLGVSGMEFTYDIASPHAPVFIVTDRKRGATFSSSAGRWENGILTLSPEQARHFTLTMRERPGVEPIGYWSMNDALGQSDRRDPKPGMVGRAFTPGGLRPRHVFVLDSGISTAELKPGGTLMAWVKLDPAKKVAAGSAPRAGQPVFSAGEGPGAFVLPAAVADFAWHHETVTFSGGHSILYLDGENRGDAGIALPSDDHNLIIGSIGNKVLLNGLLDEVRIFDRPLAPAEIRAIYLREKSAPKILQKSE